MLSCSQLRSNKLYCFTILTPFDSLWVYKNKRFKKKKKGLQLKKHERYEEREEEKKRLASCDSGERPS